MSKVTWITLNPNSERGNRFVKTCETIGMANVPFVAKRGDTSNLEVTQPMRKRLSKPQLGCLSSHMEMIKKASESSDPWFFICEDDADLSWMSDVGLNFDRLLSSVPKDAEYVAMHTRFRPLVDMFKPPRFFKNLKKGDIPHFTVGMTNHNCMAYMVRPFAAKRVVNKYYRDGKWRNLPPLPSDELFERFYQDGLWSIYTIPLVGEMNLLDSELTRSSMVLRMRRASGNAMYHTLMDPETHQTTIDNNMEMLKSVVEEFDKELLVSTLFLVATGVIMVSSGVICMMSKK